MKSFSTRGGNPLLLLGAELFDGLLLILAANQNDLALDPQGSLVRLQLLANVTVTGIAGGIGNRLVTVQNDSSFNLTLADHNGASQAANRLNNSGSDLVIGPSGFASYLYNPRTLLWDLFAL